MPKINRFSPEKTESVREPAGERSSPLQETKTKLEKGSLSSLVSGFKAAVTSRINKIRQTSGNSVWKRSFFEHIIRNDEDLNNIRKYIIDNSAKWELDKYYNTK
ncbi:MAG: transposase [bacterium]|nr:transposase [bacterium]